MNSDENNGMVYGATALATVVIIVALFQAKAFFAKPVTEQELVTHLLNTTEAPKEVANLRDFMESDRDPTLEQHVMDRVRELDEPVRACLRRWPSYPDEAKARVRTDNAGRLSGFAIQDAPPNAERCMITFLKNSILPRHANGVVTIEFPSVEEAQSGPVHTPQVGTGSGSTEIYWGQGEGSQE
jgi:hypothetical protein